MINWYRNLKIQSKYTIVILIAVLMPVVILTSIFSNQLYDMIISETISKAQDSTSTNSLEITNVLDDILDISGEITSHDYYEKLFYTSSGRSLNEICQSEDAKDFKATIESLEEDNNINIRLYMGISSTSSFFTSENSNDVFYSISKAKGTYWYGIFQGKHASKLYCPSAYLSNYERENLGDCAYITYMTAYDDGSIYPCYLAIYYSSTEYQNILNKNLSFSNGVSYIINEREEIISSTNDALSATYRLKYGEIKDSLMSSNNFISKNVMGSTVYVAIYYLQTPKWFIVTVIPEKPLLAQVDAILLRLSLEVILSICIAIVLAMSLSKSITGRMSKVVHQMSAVKNGPPTPLQPADSTDEVGELIDTYNYMANEMQNLIKQEQKTAENLRIAEFNALQAQINPHFLYNTMDMINWMAKDGKTDEVSEVVQRLSRFYKLTLSKKNTINSISDEIEHVTIYIELMNMRHGSGIDFVIDMPDELTNFSIPKLTLQPIIENSILHGILEKPEKSGTIIITGWEENDDIILLVSDDGIGIPEDTLKDILAQRPISHTQGSNVAISNTHHRLQILFGEKYGLSYSSTLGVGTEVTIRIPQLIG